jgi:hypothetical protein
MTALVLSLALALPLAAAADRRDGPSHHTRASVHYHVGDHVRYLPRGHVRLSVGLGSYYYYGGTYYRWHGPDYVVVGAPLGARVHVLPRGYVTFGVGPRRYFFVDSTYYLWEPQAREYVVVQEPDGAEQAMANAKSESSGSAEQGSGSGEVFAYPNRGQSDEQSDRDRYECHLWAADQSGYDPTYSDQPAAKNDDYRRAMTACLVARGYTVR